MDVILHQLAELLLKAIPTFILVLVLHFYLKYVFFKPLGAVLQKRFEATEGARQLAEQTMQQADAKTKEYEAALRAARSEVYQAQEQLHKRLQERESAELAAARQQAEAVIQQAKAELAKDVDAAKHSLAAQTEMLSSQIAQAVLRGSAA